MNQSTDLNLNETAFPVEVLSRAGEVHTVRTPGLPIPHPSEADVFARHDGVPSHKQDVLVKANVVLIGAGGLNSWVALGLLRSGVRHLTIIDPDLVERTNLTRQLYFGENLGKPKTTCLVDNLNAHAVSEAMITGISMRFEDAVEKMVVPADILVIGVDRNDCRLAGVLYARQRGIPAVFTMLSKDGMRCHIFLQGSKPDDACLWCALPNLDPDKIMPCASAIITSCLMASSYTIFLIHRAIMGWPPNIDLFNWRESDLMGVVPDKVGFIKKSPKCPVCTNIDK